MKKTAITIFDNYDLEAYEEAARQQLIDEHYDEEGYAPSEYEVYDLASDFAAFEWEEDFENLKNFFHDKGKAVMLRGTVGRWNGRHEAGKVFEDFEDAFYAATKDCDYWKIRDEAGHLYVECSHHDGSNSFEIKLINDKGAALLEGWEYDWNDTRTEEEVHDIIFNCNLFSALPHYVQL